jgi:hypothetical protein
MEKNIFDFDEKDFEYAGIIYLRNGVKINILVYSPDDLRELLNDKETDFLSFLAHDKQGNKVIYVKKDRIVSISIFSRIPILEEK